MASKVHPPTDEKPGEELQKQIDLAIAIALRFFRRVWLLALTVPLAVAAFLVGPRFRPPVYESEAVLLYRPVLRSDVALGDTEGGESARSRNQRLCGLLFSAKTLEQVIVGENLYARTRARLSMRDAVVAFREDGSCQGGDANTLRLSFRGGDSESVFRATKRLTDALIDLASQEGAEQARKTVAFLEAEERETAGILRRKDQERAEFLQAHPEFSSDTEPGGRGSQAQGVDTLRRQAARLRRQLAAPDKPTATQGAQGASSPPAEPKLTSESEAEIAAAKASLARAREQLSRARERFTPQHPDVIAAQNAVARAITEVERAKATARYVTPPSALPSLVAQPKPETTEADRARMVTQLVRIEKTLRDQTATEPPQADELASLETKWSELTREVATAKERHEQVAGRLFRASIIARATRAREQSPLVIVDEPYRPTRPSARGARRTGAMVAAAAVFAWLLAVLGLALLDDRIYTKSDLERLKLGGIVHEQRRGNRRF